MKPNLPEVPHPLKTTALTPDSHLNIFVNSSATISARATIRSSRSPSNMGSGSCSSTASDGSQRHPWKISALHAWRMSKISAVKEEKIGRKKLNQNVKHASDQSIHPHFYALEWSFSNFLSVTIIPHTIKHPPSHMMKTQQHFHRRLTPWRRRVDVFRQFVGPFCHRRHGRRHFATPDDVAEGLRG